MQTLIKMSRRYGSDDRFVLAGGGNTSVKDEKHLYVKGSGTSLSTISEEGFVKMNRSKLGAVWNNTYSEDAAERESEVLSDGNNHRRRHTGRHCRPDYMENDSR